MPPAKIAAGDALTAAAAGIAMLPFRSSSRNNGFQPRIIPVKKVLPNGDEAFAVHPLSVSGGSTGSGDASPKRAKTTPRAAGPPASSPAPVTQLRDDVKSKVAAPVAKLGDDVQSIIKSVVESTDCEDGRKRSSGWQPRDVYKAFSLLPSKHLPQVQREASEHRSLLRVAESKLDDAGFGVFAVRPFKAGMILCRFEGALTAATKKPAVRSQDSILTLAKKKVKAPGSKESAMKLGSSAARHEVAELQRMKSYMLSLRSAGGWVLDGSPIARALRRGSKAVELRVLCPGGKQNKVLRPIDEVGVGCMVNHGTKETANAQFILMKSDRSGFLPSEAYLQATRDIAAGEELLTRYGNAESTVWD